MGYDTSSSVSAISEAAAPRAARIRGRSRVPAARSPRFHADPQGSMHASSAAQLPLLFPICAHAPWHQRHPPHCPHVGSPVDRTATCKSHPADCLFPRTRRGQTTARCSIRTEANRPAAPRDAPLQKGGARHARGSWWCAEDTPAGMLLGLPRSARRVQSLDDSLSSASHITYRISLRSSSVWEPRCPSPRGVYALMHKHPLPSGRPCTR